MKPPRIAIAGLGYFGPNWLRNFAALESCTVAYACDLDESRCEKFRRLYPAVSFTANIDDALNDETCDAIVIATPPETHAALAKRALKRGKHVLIEKPVATSRVDAEELIKLAREKNMTLLVDHTFVFTGAVEKIASLVKTGDIGELLYFDSTRINLGLIQKNANVLWDLAIHDLSILSAIADLSAVQSVLAVGSKHYGKQIEDGHLHLNFFTGLHAHIHVSWLSPVKLRSTLIGGSKKMIVYDDTEPSEKIRVYDKGIEHDTTKADPFFPKYRAGDVTIPALDNSEALGKIAKHFIACIRGKESPRVTGAHGEQIVRILECADESMASGTPVPLFA